MINEVDEISSIEEGIKLCTAPLLEHRYIENSYVDSLIKESISNKNNNIYIGNRTIFPHYLNENNVFSTKFSFLKLKKPIFFKEKYCSLIICFCTNKKNIYHNFLFNLFELLETKEDEFLNLSLSELYNYLKAL